jgi:hypothetical protein
MMPSPDDDGLICRVTTGLSCSHVPIRVFAFRSYSLLTVL